MTLRSVLVRLLALAPLALVLSGCFPMGDSPVDEEKDPYFITGKNRRASMDYDGAIAAFENALNSNPKNASAHLELGLLYDEQKQDYATAIYHYEKHLRLRPTSNMAETVKQRIFSCKLELAKSVSFALVTRQVQDDLRKLSNTNAALHDEVEQLKSQLLEQATDFSNRLAVATHIAPIPDADPVPPPEHERRTPAVERSAPITHVRQQPHPQSTAKTHVVRPGETLALISKRYNVKISALQSANPTVEPRRLRVGQVLNIPTQRN